MSSSLPAGWGSGATRWPEGCLWFVKFAADRVGLGRSGVAQGPQGRLWVVKLMAGRVGLGCDAVAPGRLWLIKYTACAVGLGCDTMGPKAALGCQFYSRQGGARV